MATDSKSARELGLPFSDWAARGGRAHGGGTAGRRSSGIDLLVVSPGVPSDVPLLRDARARRIPIIGELELAYEGVEGELVGRDGTKTKDDDHRAPGGAREDHGRDVVVAGNVGLALSGEVARVREDGFIVAEVSSFQLDSIEAFRPLVAALLNITEDHLDRYASMEDYVESKTRVFVNQTAEDYAVVNVDDAPVVADLARRLGDRRSRERRRARSPAGCSSVTARSSPGWAGRRAEIAATADLRIPGPHNLANALAAVAAARAVGVTPEDARGRSRRSRRSSTGWRRSPRSAASST